MLTPIELDILWLLCENRGKVISSEQLFEQIWKEEVLQEQQQYGDGTHPASAGERWAMEPAQERFHQDCMRE